MRRISLVLAGRPVSDHPRPAARHLVPALVLTLAICGTAFAQQDAGTPNSDRELIQQLLRRVSQLEAEVKDLKANQAQTPAATFAATPAVSPAPEKTAETVKPEPATFPSAPPADSEAVQSGTEQASVESASDEGNMPIPGQGPNLKIRGFLDFNMGLGSDANPLIYPLTVPPGPVHNTFQFGEFDLFMTSRLSDTVSFLSEVVFGADASNFWGIDIERAQLTYKPSDYFQISGGRFHTAIGYYNTAYHHGTWFQTATGRPFMYFFEDSGGILPVHSGGITTTGLVPGTGKLNLHWIAEVGNGESSLFIGQPIVAQPVQNFLSDKNHKAFNLAGYIKPDWTPGLQIGGSYYNDVRVPPGVPHVNQEIESLYAVYITPVWEFLNEFVVERNRPYGQIKTFDTPLAYTQISRKFGQYRPYFRYQYVDLPSRDPLYAYVGRYTGPSIGLRMDFTEYAALKIQFNRLYTDAPTPKNGLDSQVSFTF